MDHQTEQEEIKPLIFNYIFHFVLFVLILTMHLIMHDRIYWLFSSIKVLYLLGAYLNIIYAIFPIYPFIIICLRKYKKNQFQLLKKFTFILLIATIVFGLIVSIAILINLLNTKVFCRECPFNLSSDHLNAVLGKYYGKHNTDKKIKNLCKSRRCVFDREEPAQDFPYYYLCNYDPRDEFDFGEIYKRKRPDGTQLSSSSQLKCEYITSYHQTIYFQKSELHSYLDLCYQESYFFLCQRFIQPEKYYDLDLDLSCPETNYLLLMIIFTVLVILIDIIISILPWTIEFISFKRIIAILSIDRIKVNSANSTEKSSHISNNDLSFKKEKTPILIIPLNDEINININNKDENNNNNKKKVLFINRNILRDSTINLKNTQETEKNYVKVFNNKHLESSERNKLNNRGINIDIELNNENNKEQIIYNNRATTKRIDNTESLNQQLNQITVNIINKNH